MEESVTENPKSHEGKNRTILSSHEEQPRSKNCRSSRLPTFLFHAFYPSFLPFFLLSLSHRIFLLLRVHSVDYSILLQLIHLSFSYNFFTLVLLWCHFQPRVWGRKKERRDSLDPLSSFSSLPIFSFTVLLFSLTLLYLFRASEKEVTKRAACTLALSLSFSFV